MYIYMVTVTGYTAKCHNFQGRPNEVNRVTSAGTHFTCFTGTKVQILTLATS